MPRYLLSFLFLFYFILFFLVLFYVMFCFVLTSPPLMLCVYLQTFEAALFWKKKKELCGKVVEVRRVSCRVMTVVVFEEDVMKLTCMLYKVDDV